MTWRAEAIGRLQREHFDLLVVGGGITGAGIALEATLRGYKVALVEASDFASGTSRRSTKLVHGGLRYLIQGATEFVREALAERTFLLEHAPGLVKPLPFLAPLQVLHEPLERVDGLLAMYERLGDPRPLPGSRHVAVDELAQRCAIFAATDGAVEYHEADTDDAQLTLAVLRAALERGAVAASRLRVVGLEAVASTVCATLRDELEDRKSVV